jgi:hypothetical protein
MIRSWRDNTILGICYSACVATLEYQAYVATPEYKAWLQAIDDFMNYPHKWLKEAYPNWETKPLVCEYYSWPPIPPHVVEQYMEMKKISKELVKILKETPEYKAYKKFEDEYHEMMRQKEGREKYRYE